MSVGINGISRLNTNDFREITIKQVDTDDYMVDVIGDKVGKVSGDFSENLKGMSNEDKIIAIIERYLDNFKINGITKPIELSFRDGEWVVIYGNNSNCVLRLQLFNKYFSKIFDKIKNKYLNNRYNFFWNGEINFVRLGIDTDRSMYGIHSIDCDECDREIECDYENYDCAEYVYVDLKLGNDGNVVNFDKEFIKEFLYYKFNLYKEDVKVIDIRYEWDNSFNPRIYKHIIRCGDFEIEIPHVDKLMFILDIVNEYNRELFVINDNIKKRQLKMEGF